MLMQSMSIVPVVGSVADCCMATCMQSYELLSFCHAFHCAASFVHLFAWDCQPFALHIMMLKLQPQAKYNAAIA